MKFVRVGGESGLFNVRTDPNETHDLSAQRPALRRRLETKWKEWDQYSLAKTPAAKPAKL